MRTKDGYLIHVGMWVYDQNGIYEIKEIRPTSILVNEIGFDCPDRDTNGCERCGNQCGQDGPCEDYYCIADTYTLLPQEIRRLHYA